MAKWTRVLTVAAAIALAAACSTNPGRPTTLPTLTPSPTASPTSSTSDLEAATNVVRQYYALLNRLSTTMDSRGLALLMTAYCRCRQQLTAIDQAKAKGERYIDHVELVSLTPVRDGNTEVSVLVEYNADSGGLVDAHGRPITRSAPRKGVRRLFRVVQQANIWLISDIGSA